MFDSSKEFLVKIISGGVKQCVLRYPSDEQLCDRARRQKTIRHFLGRGKTKSANVNTDTVDVQLFEALRVEKDGIAYTPAEASAFVERLDLARVTAAAWQGELRRIEMQVPGGRVVHVLRMPTQDQIREHERATTDTVYGNRSAEVRVALEPSGVLYDKVVEGAEGYAGAVPINHKVAAITELLTALAALLEPEEDDDPEA